MYYTKSACMHALLVLCTRRAASRSGGGAFWAIKKCRRGEVIRIIACSTNESAKKKLCPGGANYPPRPPLNAALTHIYFHCIDLINYVHIDFITLVLE